MTRPIRWLSRALLLLAALSVPAIALPQPPHPTLVKTEGGWVRGIASGDAVSWKGIPYAAPPVGALRWRMPQRAITWQGELAADQFGPACMQTDDVPKSEDCLSLNGFEIPLAMNRGVVCWSGRSS